MFKHLLKLFTLSCLLLISFSSNNNNQQHSANKRVGGLVTFTNALPKLTTFDLFNLNNKLQEDLALDSTRSFVSGQDGAAQTGSGEQEQQESEKSQTSTCGYNSCPRTDPNKLNVHLIAHSHDDIGWLKTVAQYYYNTKNKFAAVGVQHIYDSVIPQLVMDSSRRFIAVEIGFFLRWWEEQDEQMRTIVRRLVNEGRFEFTNGGWCMNDEATVNYQSTIEQMTLGLKFLNETFGACARPKVGWQIDPFGHSNEQASLFAQFGFDGMYFTRMSYEDKKQRRENKTLDLIWHADRALSGQSGSIFTNIFKDTYDAPMNFCFDALCQEDNLVDNKNSYEYNIERRATKFIEYIREYAKTKEHQHILIPMGGDFQYSSAGQNFKNMDKLIKYIRSVESTNLNIFYSTPTCYQQAVYNFYQQQEGTEKRLSEKYDDFMPYDSTETVWWSGYFSSKPAIKLIERETANLLQVSRFISLANLMRNLNSNSTITSNNNWRNDVKSHESDCLMELWEVLGDLQHHDAITGTSKEHVVHDYIRRVVDANNKCAKFIGNLRRNRLNEYLKHSSSKKYEQLKESGKKFKLDPVYLEETMFCPDLNISQCDAIESNVDISKYLNIIREHEHSFPTSDLSLAHNNNSTNTITSTSTSSSSGSSGSSSGSTANGRQLPKVNNPSSQVPNLLLKSQLKTINHQHQQQQQVDIHSFMRHKHDSKGSRSAESLPAELQTKAVLVNIYNPLARHILQHEVRLPCSGRCNLDKVKVVHLSTNETMRLTRLPIPAGIMQLPHRDALTTYEILFYANVPALGYTSFVVSDMNEDEYIDEENDPQESVIRYEKKRDLSLSSSSSPIKKTNVDHHEDELPMEELTTSSSNKCKFNGRGRSEGICDLIKINMGINNNADNNNINNNREHPGARPTRESSLSQQNPVDNVIVKFDLNSGMIVGLKRVSDGSVLNITQKFGFYFPANKLAQPGAYIFRANTSEPYLFDKPIVYKMYKRKSGSFIEIHQKWADWLWQTIRVDAKKNYIEFDYVVGPVPIIGFDQQIGREIVTRYITNMSNNGVFLTDSNDRQLMTRHRMRTNEPEQLGGSFYPVVSTIMLKNTNPKEATECNKCPADAVAILVDRAQAGTSLNEGQMELLIHRRHTRDDNFGVGEPLNEAGEDGRGLVIRGKHRIFIKFPSLPETITGKQSIKPQLIPLPATPKENLEFPKKFYINKMISNGKSAPYIESPQTYMVYDAIYNDLRQESIKQALKPLLTFDRLRISASEFVDMIANHDGKVRTDLTLLNTTLPNNIHVLTLQPWNNGDNQILIRLENLDNPLLIHPYPDYEVYESLLNFYKSVGNMEEPVSYPCKELKPRVEVNLEYLIKRIRIVELEELTLGANVRLKDDKRLNWTSEEDDYNCRTITDKATFTLGPRQIRTFLARFVHN